MKKQKEIWIDTDELEAVICGVARLSEALRAEPYSYSLAGIEAKDEDQAAAAHNFVEEYYELTAGALELIAAATSVIATSLANGDIEIVVKD